MTIARRRGRLVFASLVVPAVLVACGTKEQASPPVSTPQAAPSAPPTTIAPPTTTIPSPPPVWRTARWGMTKDELLAAFPGEAQRLAKPTDFGRAEGLTDVAIPTYETGGMKFQVLFGFESDALNRIQLSAVKAAETTCTDLEKLLTEAHSAPSDRSTTQTTLRNERIVWQRPDQTITLSCTESRSLGYRTVTLDYTPPSKT
jgi:hypothetical protein